MIRLRTPHVVRVVVAGERLGDFYKDDNGNLWRYEKRGVVTVEQRATTSAYGGKSTPWFELGTFDLNAKDQIDAWISENYPTVMGSSFPKASDGGSWWSDEGGGGGSTKSPGTLGSTVKPAPVSTTPPVARASGGSNLAVFVLLGAVGAGLIALKLLG